MRLEVTKINLINIFTYIMMFCIPIEPLIGKGYSILLYAFIGISLVSVCVKKKINISIYELIFMFFILICFMSIIYSGHKNSSTSMARQLLTNFLLAFSISQILIQGKNDDDRVKIFTKLLDCFKYGTIFVTIYLVIFEMPNLNKWDRLGQELFEDYGTYIVYSYCLIISTCFSIWKLFFSDRGLLTQNKGKFYFENLFNIIMLCILIYADVISGTRKCLICPVLFVVFYIVLKYRKKYTKLFIGIIIMIILSIIGYRFIMTNETFYNTIGRRIESMIQQFNGEEEADGSIEERNLLRTLSIQLFEKYPIAGYGIHAFRWYSYMNGGPYLYSHCNYTELLADVGIIGFILYYGAYFYIIFAAWKNLKTRKLAIYIIAFMGMNLISDYSSVTYFRHYYLIIFTIFARYLTNS